MNKQAFDYGFQQRWMELEKQAGMMDTLKGVGNRLGTAINENPEIAGTVLGTGLCAGAGGILGGGKGAVAGGLLGGGAGLGAGMGLRSLGNLNNQGARMNDQLLEVQQGQAQILDQLKQRGATAGEIKEVLGKLQRGILGDPKDWSSSHDPLLPEGVWSRLGIKQLLEQGLPRGEGNRSVPSAPRNQ